MKLSISNIAWSTEHDNTMYQFLKDNGFDGLEIAPTRIFPEKPYEHLSEARDWAQLLKDQYGMVIQRKYLDQKKKERYYWTIRRRQ